MPTPRTMERRFPQSRAGGAGRIRPRQLRRLHALWRRWTGKLKLSSAADRALRHYYIGLFTLGRAEQTLDLTGSDAEAAIRWLVKLNRWADARTAYAAGTSGRRGYPERRRIPPNPSAWSALWGCAASLGMERADLDNFIRRHYAGAGLQSVADLRTMADLNRVLWGLKAMLRRRARNERSSRNRLRAAQITSKRLLKNDPMLSF